MSACETAVGDDSTSHTGVEVEGLGAIAQQAGAKAVLATLWPVADASTAALMRELYLAHKTDHLTKPTRCAKRSWRCCMGVSRSKYRTMPNAAWYAAPPGEPQGILPSIPRRPMRIRFFGRLSC